MFRGFLGLVATLLVVGLLVGVGAGIYQAGVTQGVPESMRPWRRGIRVGCREDMYAGCKLAVVSGGES